MARTVTTNSGVTATSSMSTSIGTIGRRGMALIAIGGRVADPVFGLTSSNGHAYGHFAIANRNLDVFWHELVDEVDSITITDSIGGGGQHYAWVSHFVSYTLLDNLGFTVEATDETTVASGATTITDAALTGVAGAFAWDYFGYALVASTGITSRTLTPSSPLTSATVTQQQDWNDAFGSPQGNSIGGAAVLGLAVDTDGPHTWTVTSPGAGDSDVGAALLISERFIAGGIWGEVRHG